jgi:hypothetical protein
MGRSNKVSNWPRAIATATISQMTVGVVSVIRTVHSAAPIRSPPASIAPRKPTAVPRTRVGKALGLISEEGPRPGAVGGLIVQEVHDRDHGSRVHDQEDQVERSDHESGDDQHLPTPPPFPERTAEHVEQKSDRPAHQQQPPRFITGEAFDPGEEVRDIEVGRRTRGAVTQANAREQSIQLFGERLASI